MKSAYELAMERLAATSPSVKLTDAQRAELAELDNLYTARIAERRVFLEGQIRAAAGDPAAEHDLRRQLASEVARLEEERDAKKERVRQAAG